MLTLPVGKAGVKPSGKIFVCDFAVRALVTLDYCFVFPFLEIVLKNCVSLNPGKISLVIFIVNCNGGVVRHFLFVVFHRHYVLAILCFALGNTVAVISIVISFHNEIPAATLTFSKTDIQLKHFWSKSLNCADLFLIKAQNAGILYVFRGFLTKSKGKSADLNHGSDHSPLPKANTIYL